MTSSWFLPQFSFDLVRTKLGGFGLVRGMVRVALGVRVRVSHFILFILYFMK